MTSDTLRHIPVLHTTVLAVLAPAPGDSVLDVTLGYGGHAQLFLEAIGPTGKLIALDADSENLALAKEGLSGFANVTFHHANFRQLEECDLPPVDILFADLGLSSMHVDDPTRGFTFRADAPLDLRYDRTQGQTAADLPESSSEKEVMRILNEYGELHPSLKLAHALAGKRWGTTTAVRTVVEGIYGLRAKQVLPQVFQAPRIAVNDELESLKILLEQGPKLLKKGGRMGVLSFHSLEDRLVKHTFRSLTTPIKDPITGTVATPALFKLLTPRSLTPSLEERASNPRSRSVHFRALKRL